MDAHRRFGSREFKEKLTTAKNYKRLGLNTQRGFTAFFTKTGLSKAGTFAAGAGFALIFYLLVLSPYFVISDITVAGNNQVPTEQISSLIKSLESKKILLVPQNSFFVLNQSRVNNVFAKNLPEIREVKSKRSWPNKISVEVTERTPALILYNRGKYYLLDDQGFVIKRTESIGDHLVVTDQVDEEVKIGEVISGKLIPFIISMQRQWPGKITVPLASAKIPGKGAAEVEFVSSEGWSVFFSTDRPVNNQLGNLSTLLGKQIRSGERNNLAYVDLRLTKWAYYCFKSTPCQQTDPDRLPDTASAIKSTVEPLEPSDEKPETVDNQE